MSSILHQSWISCSDMLSVSRFHLGSSHFAQKLSLPFQLFSYFSQCLISLIERLNIRGVVSSACPASGSDTFSVPISPAHSLLLAQLFVWKLFAQSMNLISLSPTPFLKHPLCTSLICVIPGDLFEVLQIFPGFPSTSKGMIIYLTFSWQPAHTGLVLSDFLE